MYVCIADGIPKWEQQLADSRTVRSSKPGGVKIFRTHPDQPWILPNL